MRDRLNTYTAYSIGCAVVWALILAVVATVAKKDTRDKIFISCGGWWQGWTSATIARYVYPPPKPRRRSRR